MHSIRCRWLQDEEIHKEEDFRLQVVDNMCKIRLRGLEDEAIRVGELWSGRPAMLLLLRRPGYCTKFLLNLSNLPAHSLRLVNTYTNDQYAVQDILQCFY